MDPVEAGEWLVGRPQQLVFLTGLDPNNKESHSALVSTFGLQQEITVLTARKAKDEKLDVGFYQY
ncbi:hypothetical protein ANCDUO_25935 [Ancylostoma duodenale]|uniref:Uncharacterized protein n=1 Tax=Ancylostoma duodenale TaxID=51022 RepID=A0A0C2FGG8_9BILA|nr:hypothetical protein ANCDUO_25935 [Ancylostoma duodenale]